MTNSVKDSSLLNLRNILMDSDATFILSFNQSRPTHKYIYIYTLKCINNEAF